jgi:hypothetical protein
MATETDSLPRIKLEDLFLTIREFEKEPASTLERLRCRICVNRKQKLSGDLYWSTARDNAIELQRLGLLEAGSFPKDKKAYESMKEKRLLITPAGNDVIALFRSDRSAAYDGLFKSMYAIHPYLRSFVKAITKQHLIAPVITSLKDHVSSRYASAKQLSDDVAKQTFDTDSLLSVTESRIQRSLNDTEVNTISSALRILVEESAYSAISEEPIDFSKKFLLKLNDIVMPNIFRHMDLAFDYRTHRTLWGFGQEWKLWQSTSAHPDYDGRLVHRTATIRLTPEEASVQSLTYDSGLKKTAENFLPKLFQAYQKIKNTYVTAWNLRAVFCLDNLCQDSVFDRLMEEHYTGSDEYGLQLEIQRQKGQYDRPLRLGNRNIGLVRVVKRQS